MPALVGIVVLSAYPETVPFIAGSFITHLIPVYAIKIKIKQERGMNLTFFICIIELFIK